MKNLHFTKIPSVATGPEGDWCNDLLSTVEVPLGSVPMNHPTARTVNLLVAAAKESPWQAIIAGLTIYATSLLIARSLNNPLPKFLSRTLSSLAESDGTSRTLS